MYLINHKEEGRIRQEREREGWKEGGDEGGRGQKLLEQSCKLFHVHAKFSPVPILRMPRKAVTPWYLQEL